jgi:hypothetical protein
MGTRAVGATDEAGVPSAEHRYIYTGASDAKRAGAFAVRPNRKGIRRKLSTFNIILLLFGTGGAIVFSISNVISIDRLSLENSRLRARLEQIERVNGDLRAEIGRKSTWDRVNLLASNQLGLHPARQQPEMLTIDWAKARQLSAARPSGK